MGKDTSEQFEQPGEPEKDFTADDTPSKALAPENAGLFPVSGERDTEAVTRSMVDRMFKAETLDDLFDSLQGTSSDMLIGKTLKIEGVEWDVYEADTGPIPLAKVQAHNAIDGDEVEFVTTSPMLTAFIRRAEVIGELPFTARIEEKKTRSGRGALNFVRP